MKYLLVVPTIRHARLFVRERMTGKIDPDDESTWGWVATRQAAANQLARMDRYGVELPETVYVARYTFSGWEVDQDAGWIWLERHRNIVTRP